MATNPKTLTDNAAALAGTIALGELIEFFDRDWLDSHMAQSATGRAWAKRANAQIAKAKAKHARLIS